VEGARKGGTPRERWRDLSEEDLQNAVTKKGQAVGRDRRKWSNSLFETKASDGLWFLRRRRNFSASVAV
jgi:hypothetical protein